ncbi:oxidoreductase [Neoasaia chiangmaiensis NBRC 101099]|nr:oxidoreductase [Neoasaia chiangmaiensis NBRC 101099]
MSASAGAMPIAGGTNLLDLSKLEVETPSRLVDIRQIDALRGVRETTEGEVRIGALVSNAELAAHPVIRARYPLLSRAILAGASGQIRNMASTGGNLLQRTRCVQFYDTSSACNKRQPGSGCGALHGANRMNAIVGGSEHCIAVHPSDMAVAMRVLDAVVEIQGADGAVRHVPIGAFYRLPGDTPQNETVVRQGDIITAVLLPPAPPGQQFYRKVRDRASYAFALVSVGAVVAVEDGRFSTVRFGFGGIAPKPWRVEAAEASLKGRAVSREAVRDACDMALSGAIGRGDNDFKIPLAHHTLAAVLAV